SYLRVRGYCLFYRSNQSYAFCIQSTKSQIYITLVRVVVKLSNRLLILRSILMRFKHQAVVLAKKAFLVRLSYIITRVTANDITQKDIALLVGCSPSQISAIKNEREKAVTIETLMRVADTLR